MKQIEVSGRSDVGRVRNENQDCFLIERIIQQTGSLSLKLGLPSIHFDQYGLLLAVADGMGGHKGGSFASRIALDHFSKLVHEQIQAGFSTTRVSQLLDTAIVQSHQLLLNYSKNNPELFDMGTTIVGLCLRKDDLTVFHAGDSRLYRFRNGFIKQLTQDHSVVQSLINSGQLDAEAIEKHVQKHIITNCLGGGADKECKPEIQPIANPGPGDIFLLCSDGLVNPVNISEMENILNLSVPIHEKADLLIQKANENGGPDNVTVLLCQFYE